MTDLRYYMLLAKEANVFKDIELDIMKEGLEEWERRPDRKATLVELSAGGRVSGFAFYLPAQQTDFTFELKWLVIDRLSAKRGVGIQLINRIEDDLRHSHGNAILRVESSSRKDSILPENFYLDAGFSLIGHIPDFYGKQDDYFIYAKHIFVPRAYPEPAEGEAKPEA